MNNNQQEKGIEKEKEKKPVVGITQGDFNGIGYEIIIKALMEQRMMEICTPVVYGSSKIASYHRKVLNYNEFNFNLIKKADAAHPKRANIVNVTDKEVKIDLGESSEIAGQLAVMSLEMAVSDLKQNNIDVLVTCPINKKNIQSKEFTFKGHTEFLADRFSVGEHVMMMISDTIRMGFVTGHLSIANLPSSLNEDLIVRKLVVMNNALIRDFGVRKPKIAVLGLNPHSGDEGVIGSEEQEIIVPALKRAQNENILCFGPFPPDGYFGSVKYMQFDATLAMYHDQGMIAFKLLSFDNGVNYTAGLPFVRTSPAHGTAYEIAGKNEANPESFRHAIFLACDVHNNRKLYDELNSNPLKTKVHESPPDDDSSPIINP